MTVGANDSLTAISQRYGVPTNAILTANAFGNASEIQPGREIVIPVYNANGQAVAASGPAPVRAAAAPPPAPAPVRTAAQAPAPAKEKLAFVVGPKPASQKTAQAAEKPDPAAKTEKTRVRPGMVASAKPAPAPAPVVQTAAAKPAPAPAAKPAPVAVAQKPAEPAKPAPQPVVVAQKPAEAVKPAPQPEPVKVAKVEPAPAKPAAPPAAQAYAPQPEPAKDVNATASLPSGPATDFRWPARGRVIAGFGANGGNEGINIALPEGTPVKATDDGTVTYVGGDVKAYGNLVLIKHDNGFVSAYAHNGELTVKRGERVRRGQVVAKSGQSGNVTSPQLHFELRKGQAAVDPVPHLNGG
jgi:murein DD-endopeptidase MepM/ murein hydrolase activator NlpD